jgi:hypothetical protein
MNDDSVAFVRVESPRLHHSAFIIHNRLRVIMHLVEAKAA